MSTNGPSPATVPPPVDGSPHPASPGLGGHAARGRAWMTVQSVGGKALNALGHVVLAWLLLEEDFGLVSMAYTAVAFPSLIYQLGVREALLRRQDALDRWTGPAVWMSAVAGVLAALAMLAAAPVAVGVFYGTSPASDAAAAARRLTWLIVWIASAAPLSAVAMVPLAKLQSQLRFRLLSGIEFGAAVGQTLLSVGFAAVGFGAYSFVLPWPIVGAIRLGLLWYYARPAAGWRRPGFGDWRLLIGDSSLVLAARAFGMFVLVGDYLVLGHWHDDDAVGVYYFAFNLSMQTAMLLAVNMDAVLLPVLAKMGDDPPRQREGFLSVARAWALIAVPVCLLQAAVADPVIRLLFQPRWYGAIPVLQLLSIGMAFRVIALPARTMIQSQGRFRAMVWLSAAGAAVFLAAVAPAAALAPPARAAVWVAAAVAAYFVVEGPVLVWAAVRPAGGRWGDVLNVYAVPVLAGGAAVVAAATAAGWLMLADGAGERLAQIGLICAISAALYLPAARVLAPRAWRDLSARLHGLLHR